jgi:AcrR family transcriptional regulator
MTSVNTKSRSYRSARREEQLRGTRRAILDAARRLFRERGYDKTTISAIASGAAVAEPTVYKHFGSKRAVLLALIDDTINVRVPPRLETVLEQASPRGRLAALARMCVDLASAAPDVVSVTLSAGKSDPQLGEMVRQMAEGRRRSAGLIARSLSTDGALRAACSEEQARDVMFALASPDLYDVLVTRFGWSDSQFEAWLSETLEASLLESTAAQT